MIEISTQISDMMTFSIDVSTHGSAGLQPDH